ncbi:Oidioi.mRNA.OKI2018_I69.chr1.g2975.t1.cds [Oikopleura dioica]|uniref:Oidioi.mRNA.OKI2018_I69.chr1.g2975.t1.cds n=1 Tax=Oikopleura dioica TaxID=34765 RepID=A0ABN7SSQ4_OIKDI|nr:Oidioi.mRNA.OKI2018_I69.chr1.g2975.t1.cds [Oikopleura dioica]
MTIERPSILKTKDTFGAISDKSTQITRLASTMEVTTLRNLSFRSGTDKGHNDHVRKLFTLRGKEIKTLADIFRAPEPAFIAIGRDEVTNSILATAIQELNPTSSGAIKAAEKHWGQKITNPTRDMRVTRMTNHLVPPVNSRAPKKFTSPGRSESPRKSRSQAKLQNQKQAKSQDIFTVSPDVYSTKLTELDRRSQETLRRLEAHIRTRELELKEKQEEELNNIKKSLLDVMKEKEGSYYQRKNEIMKYGFSS